MDKLTPYIKNKLKDLINNNLSLSGYNFIISTEDELTIEPFDSFHITNIDFSHEWVKLRKAGGEEVLLYCLHVNEYDARYFLKNIAVRILQTEGDESWPKIERAFNKYEIDWREVSLHFKRAGLEAPEHFKKAF